MAGTGEWRFALFVGLGNLSVFREELIFTETGVPHPLEELQVTGAVSTTPGGQAK